MYKKFIDLPFTDDFMFKAFCKNPNNLPIVKRMIEMVISKEIVDIRYIGTEETVRATTEDKGIRFDVLLKDKTKYINIEMQTIYKKEIPLKSRYYRSSLDVRQLRPGMEYQELKENYVIFLCLTDMFDRGLPVYTFHTICEEDKTLNLEDKRTTIFINASGRGDQ